MDAPVPQKPRDIEYASQLHHALMNPLTVVVGYAQLLSTRDDLPADARTQVDRIFTEARECVRIIETARQAARQEAAAAAGEGAGARTAPAIRKKVLIVDDEAVILRLTSEILGTEFEVTGISDADEALKRLLIDDVDVILLDLNLGGRIGGRELYETLRVQQPEVADRVVFVTGGVVSEREQEFLRGCGREVLQKPFHIKMLREMVRRLAG
jgi:CheY-like chemotaxis protein